jgi:hypothetical protein
MPRQTLAASWLGFDDQTAATVGLDFLHRNLIVSYFNYFHRAITGPGKGFIAAMGEIPSL